MVRERWSWYAMFLEKFFFAVELILLKDFI